MNGMETIDLGPAADRLCALIAAVPDTELGRVTPCTEYTVGDLLDHLHGVTFAFGGAAVKADGPTATMGPSGDAANLPVDWRTSLPERIRGLAQAWADPAAWEGMTKVGGGELPGGVAGIVAFGELTVHSWDLARATELPFEPDEVGVTPLLALTSQTFGAPDADRGPAFGPLVPVPEGSPSFDRVLGLLGRDPGWASPG